MSAWKTPNHRIADDIERRAALIRQTRETSSDLTKSAPFTMLHSSIRTATRISRTLCLRGNEMKRLKSRYRSTAHCILLHANPSRAYRNSKVFQSKININNIKYVEASDRSVNFKETYIYKKMLHLRSFVLYNHQ